MIPFFSLGMIHFYCLQNRASGASLILLLQNQGMQNVHNHWIAPYHSVWKDHLRFNTINLLWITAFIRKESILFQAENFS
ncbi:hypothetical protein K1719_023506 [Acacia pycnantha]|nr:hypothetical protein K1719_023506 [Acacia pycnantha]